mgnify:CR=1 FL=1
MTSFNPRTRVGCDKSAEKHSWPREGFNPRTRVGCDRRGDALRCTAAKFQSTHPRGVRPTSKRHSVPFGSHVSIHAPAWGATVVVSAPSVITHGFNPRTRVGCDGRVPAPKPEPEPVSIHAPAWGATPSEEGQFAKKIGFNPRTRVGCDCFHVLSSRFP